VSFNDKRLLCCSFRTVTSEILKYNNSGCIHTLMYLVLVVCDASIVTVK